MQTTEVKTTEMKPVVAEAIEPTEEAIQQRRQEKFLRLTDNVVNIKRKLGKDGVPSGKKAKLVWQLSHLERVVIPRFLERQPLS